MRKAIASLLRWQAVRLLSRVNPQIVCIAGSVGKTSTTQAIASLLESTLTVRKTFGNYNTDIGIPCSLFEQRIPLHIANPFSWVVLLCKNELKIFSAKNHTFDVAVLELGTDSIGEIATYAWLKPDISVVTAVAPEHMEIFKTIDVVAKEELTVIGYSKQAILNETMVDKQFVLGDEVEWYSGATIAEKYKKSLPDLWGEHSYDAVASAILVAEKLGLEQEQILAGLSNIKSQPGRMNKLDGVNGSVIIDDTYNSSPEAVKAALKYLYTCEGFKIALLGNMNELGSTSQKEHIEIGELCDPSFLSLVVTLGLDANRYTASTAQQKGCKVIKADTPYEAGEIIKEFVNKSQSSVTVLCKGSQNGVYAEEAVKILLNNDKDSQYLVRQSDSWLQKKRNAFQKASV